MRTIAALVIISIALWCGAAQAANYYVDATAGNDSRTYAQASNPATPWKTIAKINALTPTSLTAGSTVYFKCGETWREQLTVPSSGSYGLPITFTSYGKGAKPILKGSELVKTWIYKSGSTAKTWKTSLAAETYQVFFNGVRGTKVASIAAVNGTGKWFWADGTLYIFSTSNPTTDYANPGVEYSSGAHPYGITASGKDYITIENINVSRQNAFGIYGKDGTDHWIVDGVTAENNYRHGIDFGGSGSSDVTVKNCITSYNGASGIHGGGNNTNFLIQNNQINNNCWGGNAVHAWQGGIYFGTVAIEGIIVEKNKIYNNGDIAITSIINGCGIWFDGDAVEGEAGYQSEVTPSIARYNLIYGNKSGIKFEHTNHCQAYGNVVYDSMNDSSQYQFGIGIYIARDVHDNVVYNNTTYHNRINLALRGDYPKQNGNVTKNIFKNNIADNAITYELSTAFGGDNEAPYGSGNVFAYNCFGTEYSYFIEVSAGQFSSTYKNWEDYYKAPTHSVAKDPNLQDPTKGKFWCAPSSPCINAGDSTLGSPYNYGLDSNSSWPSAVRTHLRSGVWDIGAYVNGALSAPDNFNFIPVQK